MYEKHVQQNGLTDKTKNGEACSRMKTKQKALRMSDQNLGMEIIIG